MATAEEHVGKLEERLGHWGAMLDEFVAKADKGDEKAKVDYHKRIEDCRAKHQAAELKLAELKVAGFEKWDQFKSSIGSAWNEAETAFKDLRHPAKP